MTESPVTKPSLRRLLRARRDALPADQRARWSSVIAGKAADLPAVAAASGVFCYVSFASEVDTHGLIRLLLERGKAVAVPRLAAQSPGVDPRSPRPMYAQPIASLDDLEPGAYGFLEPPPTAASRQLACDVAIVPGLAFTRAGDRLGYGAGHYDRWFAEHPGADAIGLCFEAQIVAALPVEPHDRRMRVVVTERS